MCRLCPVHTKVGPGCKPISYPGGWPGYSLPGLCAYYLAVDMMTCKTLNTDLACHSTVLWLRRHLFVSASTAGRIRIAGHTGRICDNSAARCRT